MRRKVAHHRARLPVGYFLVDDRPCQPVWSIWRNIRRYLPRPMGFDINVFCPSLMTQPVLRSYWLFQTSRGKQSPEYLLSVSLGPSGRPNRFIRILKWSSKTKLSTVCSSIWRTTRPTTPYRPQGNSVSEHLHYNSHMLCSGLMSISNSRIGRRSFRLSN